MSPARARTSSTPDAVRSLLTEKLRPMLLVRCMFQVVPPLGGICAAHDTGVACG